MQRNMIITKAPVRISLGGGGTDLPSYYEKREGFLIAGAINKYVFVGANMQFYKDIILKYSSIEKVPCIYKINHRLFREALKLYSIKDSIELTSLADIPAGTGLGSSGAFLVALLNTLHMYKYHSLPLKRVVAEEACTIELDILKEHEGKQDKYACAFGDIYGYKFHKSGKVDVIPLINNDITREHLRQHLLLFFTGIRREKRAGEVLKYQDEKCKKDDSRMFQYLDDIKAIGLETKSAFEEGRYDYFGTLLNKHWVIKKKYNPYASNEFIDKCYDVALNKGALGGKLIGAGDGGFLMFYHPGPQKQIWGFLDAMKGCGLTHMDYQFDTEGVQTIMEEDG